MGTEWLGLDDHSHVIYSSHLRLVQAVPARQLYSQLGMFDECAARADLGLTFPGPWVPVPDPHSTQPFLPGPLERYRTDTVG